MNTLTEREKLAFKAVFALALKASKDILSSKFRNKITYYDALTIVMEFLYFNVRQEG